MRAEGVRRGSKRWVNEGGPAPTTAAARGGRRTLFNSVDPVVTWITDRRFSFTSRPDLNWLPRQSNLRAASRIWQRKAVGNVHEKIKKVSETRRRNVPSPPWLRTAL